MSTASQKSFVFTGWHMAGVMVLFFGTIISVNVFMAYNAITSWSGLVVPNTYVASQQFNGKVAQARALAATGVNGRLAVTADGVRYEVLGADGQPVATDRLVLNFKRPVGEHQDFSIEMVAEGQGVFAASRQILPGHWIVEAIAERGGERILHHAERVSVHGAKK
ncbi:FixH family protein [Aliirhizobium smilacinae]|uniref:Cation transporter n=1 Tax=Aliirhizobium smilacinae TaxID=1395944 RepID=A0A5C4XN34_9HYPH|nr:FixH family protein [Rhizobium smilacinae]TNM64903.1 cation transporter [Rhizobium smilacinae]